MAEHANGCDTGAEAMAACRGRKKLRLTPFASQARSVVGCTTKIGTLQIPLLIFGVFSGRSQEPCKEHSQEMHVIHVHEKEPT